MNKAILAHVRQYRPGPAVRVFHREMSDYRQLPEDQIIALVARRDAGDQEAVDLLVCHNWRLVWLMTRPFRRNTGLDVDDLVQEGNVGLIQAANGYDAVNGAKFSTFACVCIYNRLLNWCQKTQRQLRGEVMQLSKFLQCDPGDEDNYKSLWRYLIDPNAPEPSDIMETAELCTLVAVKLRALHPRMRDILRRRSEGATLAEVAAVHGRTRERIRQLERVALHKLAIQFGQEQPVHKTFGYSNRAA